jgi:hypothetical protein
MDRRVRERLAVEEKESMWQERREVAKAVHRERKEADLGPARKTKAKAPPPLLPRR